MAGGDRRRGDGDQLGTADLAEDLDRVGDAGDPPHRFLHGGALAGEALVVDAGAAADPRRRLATGQRGGDRGRRRGVADAHLAEHEEVAVERVDGVDGGAARRLRSVARSSAASNRMSPVGWPTPTSIARHLGAGDPGEGVDRRAPFAVGRRASPRSRPSDRRSPSWPRRRRDRRRRSTRPAGGRPGGRFAASRPPRRRSRRATPAHRSVAGCRPPGRAPRRGRSRRAAGRSTSWSWRRVIGVAFRSSSRTMDGGSSRRSARPATSSNECVGARRPSAGSPGRGRRGTGGRGRCRGGRPGRPRS